MGDLVRCRDCHWWIWREDFVARAQQVGSLLPFCLSDDAKHSCPSGRVAEAIPATGEEEERGT